MRHGEGRRSANGKRRLVASLSAAAVTVALLAGTGPASRAGIATPGPDDGIFGRTPRVRIDAAPALPQGFSDTEVLTGPLGYPTAVQFSPDGRVFVAEKSGLIVLFQSLTDPTWNFFADLTDEVHNYWDRGLLGMALDPQFPTKPYVYVLYAYDGPYGQFPKWNDACADPTGNGCVVSARLSRLTAVGDVMGSEQHLIDLQWCHQYPSHSIGALAFGADGALYVSGGDGASFTFEDYGQDGSPLNPCADPPAGLGGKEKKPTAEGGALRSQDVRTTGDATTLDGAVLRVDPETGDGMPDNPMAGSADPNTRRIVAYGLRNPFRFTIRPGTNDLWIGDVGWNTWEEIDRVPSPTDSPVKDFGWPCYENLDRPYTGLNICNGWTQDPPYYAYNHNDPVVPGESCPSGSSSISGMAFYEGATYPSSYDGALFFADFSRNCIWAMMPGADGLPDPSNIQTFVADAPGPVALIAGPDGDIFYVSFEEQGAIHRITYTPGNQNPVAVATADPTSGPAPLSVAFDGTGSYDPDPGDTITYAWDLDGDGQYDDSTAAQPTFVYDAGGVYEAGLQVSDGRGGVGTATVEITVGNSSPTPFIDTPDGSLTWVVGQPISFSGHATDPEEGDLPASALTWKLIIDHCPSTCHQHVVQTWEGVADGSFNAPDHDYPSHLELQLQATDSGGLQTTTVVELYPQTVNLTFKSVPKGLKLGANAYKTKTPKTLTFIMGGKVSLSAPSPQNGGGQRWVFVSWSDGGARSHDVTADAPTTYTATFQAQSGARTVSHSGPGRV